MDCCPFFSIIIPVYNRSSVIGKTIASIFDQEYKNFELIIVDDGSTDGTYEVLNGLCKNRFNIYRTSNCERGAARNFGAARSKGKYLIFFDSDDIMYPWHLNSIKKFVYQYKYPPVLYTGFEYVDVEGNVLKKVLKGNSLFKYKILYDNFLGCNSVVVKSSVFKEFYFSQDRKLSTAEDRELWLRIAARYQFHFVPVIGFAMIEHPGRSLNNLNANRIEEVRLALVKSLENDRDFLMGFGRLSAFFFAYELSLLISIWACEGKTQAAFMYLKRVIRLFPLIVFSKRFCAGFKNLCLAKWRLFSLLK